MSATDIQTQQQLAEEYDGDAAPNVVVAGDDVTEVLPIDIYDGDDEPKEDDDRPKFSKLALNGRVFDVDVAFRIIENEDTTALPWAHVRYVDMLLEPTNKKLYTIDQPARWEGIWTELGKDPVEIGVKSMAFSHDNKRMVNVIMDNGWVLKCEYLSRSEQCIPISFAPVKVLTGEEKATDDANELEIREKVRSELRRRYPATGIYCGELDMHVGACSIETAGRVRHKKHIPTCVESEDAQIAKFLYRRDNHDFIGKGLCSCPRQMTPRQEDMINDMWLNGKDPSWYMLEKRGWGITVAISEYIVRRVVELQRLWLNKETEVVMLYTGSTPERCASFHNVLFNACLVQSMVVASVNDNLLSIQSDKFVIKIHIQPHSFITQHEDKEKWTFPCDWLFVDDLCDSFAEQNLFYFLQTHLYIDPLQAFLFGTSDDYDLRHKTEGKVLAARNNAFINKYQRLQYESSKRAEKEEKKKNKKNKNPKK
jgi:hypothetical protein